MSRPRRGECQRWYSRFTQWSFVIEGEKVCQRSGVAARERSPDAGMYTLGASGSIDGGEIDHGDGNTGSEGYTGADFRDFDGISADRGAEGGDRAGYFYENRGRGK